MAESETLTLRRIPRLELNELAREWGFAIAAEEESEYLRLVDGVLSVLDELDRHPVPVENVEAVRDPGRPPGPGEDPCNAVVRWCRVESTHEGVLGGMRIAVKDSVAVAGVPMTCGSRILTGFVPERDAVVTERILEAGGVIAAITNMDDLAFSGGGDTSCYGPTLCPFDLARTAGGSSGGSAAALWYEGVDAAIGSDQGGSIRVPAAWCGVIGLKPTHGLVPYTGIAGIDRTFDHAGPLGRTAESVARLLQAVTSGGSAAPQRGDTAVADYLSAVAGAADDLRGIRLGLVAESLGEGVGATAEVAEATQETLERLRELGADIREVSLPEHLQAGGIAFAGFVEGMTALMAGGGNGYHWFGRYSPDLALALRRGLTARAGELPASVKTALLVGTHLRRSYLGAVYAQAQNLRPWLRSAYDRALEGLDALLLPATPGLPHRDDPALSLSDRVLRGWGVLANTYPTDMTGHPALTIPVAETGGLPVGLMLVGRPLAEARLLQVARTVEGSLGWRPDPSLAAAAGRAPSLTPKGPPSD